MWQISSISTTQRPGDMLIYFVLCVGVGDGDLVGSPGAENLVAANFIALNRGYYRTLRKPMLAPSCFDRFVCIARVITSSP